MPSAVCLGISSGPFRMMLRSGIVSALARIIL